MTYLSKCILLFCLITTGTSIVIIIIPAITNRTINIDDTIILNPIVEHWHSVHVVVIVIIGVDPIDEWHNHYILQ